MIIFVPESPQGLKKREREKERKRERDGETKPGTKT